jgi:O-antigen/teichoic acid export membrane protein
VRFRPVLAPRIILRSLPAALPYLISALIILLAIRAEFLVFGYFGTADELGLFGMAVKIVEAGMLLPMALGSVMAPRFSKGHAQGADTLRRLYFSSLEILTALAIGSAFVAFLLIPVVPLVLPEPGFAGIDRILFLLFLGYPAACIFVFNTFFLFGASRQRWPLALLVTLAALQLALNIILQARLGLTGAALSYTVFMALAAVLSSGFILAVYTGSKGLSRYLAAPAGASTLALLAYLLSAGMAEGTQLLAALVAFAATFWAVHKYVPQHATRIDLSN